MSDPAKRIARWSTKFNAERLKTDIENLRPAMLASVQAVFPELVLMESQVKQVLDGKNVATIQYPFYLAFGRELWRLIRQQVSGPSLAREAAVLVDKWKARGLSQAILEAIRSEVFSISPPSP